MDYSSARLQAYLLYDLNKGNIWSCTFRSLKNKASLISCHGESS